jgi:hypothetical protein
VIADSLYIDVFLQTYRNFMTPALLFEKLKARFMMKTMKVIKEEEITHMTKEQLSQERKPEIVELDQETLQLVKLRFERKIFLFGIIDITFSLLFFLSPNNLELVR